MTLPIRTLDLPSLSLRDALDLAVLVEEEAKERYEELADQLELHHTPEAASFFRFMANNEEKHRLELASRRRHLFADSPSTVHRGMIFDVEAPDYSEAAIFMTPRQALAAARRSEEKAHGFFVELLAEIKEPEVAALFAELRDEEILHQELIDREIAKLPPDEPFAAADFADEPVSH